LILLVGRLERRPARKNDFYILDALPATETSDTGSVRASKYFLFHRLLVNVVFVNIEQVFTSYVRSCLTQGNETSSVEQEH